MVVVCVGICAWWCLLVVCCVLITLIVLGILVAMNFGGLFNFDCVCLFASLQVVFSVSIGFSVCFVCLLFVWIAAVCARLVWLWLLIGFRITLCSLLLLCGCG